MTEKLEFDFKDFNVILDELSRHIKEAEAGLKSHGYCIAGYIDIDESPGFQLGWDLIDGGAHGLRIFLIHNDKKTPLISAKIEYRLRFARKYIPRLIAHLNSITESFFFNIFKEEIKGVEIKINNQVKRRLR